MPSTYLLRDGFSYSYKFVCDQCGYEDLLRISVDNREPIDCPMGCGAVYVQTWPDRQSPALVRVDNC